MERWVFFPPEATKNPTSVEAIRAWVANEGLHCSLNVNLWKEPSNWGILPADVARHVADAHFRMNGRDPNETVTQIRTLFVAELSRPTSQAFGEDRKSVV